MTAPSRWVAVAASIAIVTVTVVGVAISDPDTSDRSAAIDDDPGTDPLDERRAQELPTAIAATPAHGCGDLPIAFENPVAGYTLCYPDGWGFLRLDEPEPVATLDGLEAASVRLASSETFPWRPGTLPLDAVAAGAGIIEITTLPSFAAGEGEDCTPEAGMFEDALACRVRLDPMALAPQRGGPVLEILSVHDRPGGVVVVRSYTSLDPELRRSVRAIVSTLRAIEEPA